jgi:hypothetical protein
VSGNDTYKFGLPHPMLERNLIIKKVKNQQPHDYNLTSTLAATDSKAYL